MDPADRRFRRQQYAAQKILIERARLQVFRLTRNHWPWADKLDAFLRALPAIAALIRDQRGPYIARINRKGEISGIEFLRRQ